MANVDKSAAVDKKIKSKNKPQVKTKDSQEMDLIEGSKVELNDDLTIDETSPTDDVNNSNNRVAVITRVSTATLDDVNFKIGEQISNFIEKTKPEIELSVNDGAKCQTAFYKTLLQIFKLDNNHFTTLMEWLILVIRSSREREDAFSDKYIMRYHSAMNLSPRELREFRSLVNLICTTADLVNKRLVPLKININALIGRQNNQQIKNNIINFYIS